MIPFLILWRGPGLTPAASPLPWAAGMTLLLGGAAVYAWCALDFVVAGRGTPIHFDPPRNLVARGPYRLSRNPMYLAVSLAIAGEALLFASWPLAAWALGHFLFLHALVTLHEEPLLRKRFGAAYDTYLREVPRWLPRFRAGRIRI